MLPQVATIDFETRGFERRPEYPPSPCGVSIATPGKASRYYAFDHASENNSTYDEASDALKAAWKYPILCHNAKFDYDVALNFFDLPPKRWQDIHDTQYLIFLHDPHAFNMGLKESAKRILNFDTDERDELKDWILTRKKEFNIKPSEYMSCVWRAPGPLAGRYAIGDVDRTLALFRHLYPLVIGDGMEEAYDRERKLMPYLLEAETRGIRIDRVALDVAARSYQGSNEIVERWLRRKLGSAELNLDSDAAVAEILDAKKIVTEWDLTPTGKKSTSKKTMTLDRFHDKQIGLALGYRNRLQTCMSTFMLPWLEQSASSDRIYTNWNQTRNDQQKGARTGRLSSNPNFQNISSEWEGREGYTHPSFIKGLEPLPFLRRFVLPEEGHLILKRDYSQQEFRILAHFENAQLMARYLAEPDLDMHKFVQATIKDLTGQDVERKKIKTLNFGILYGMGQGLLAQSMHVDLTTARTLKSSHSQALPGVDILNRGLKAMARAGEPLYTWGGRKYYCEAPILKNGRGITFEYKMLNYLIQGSAADCTKQAANNYADMAEHGEFMLTIHDEFEVSAPIKHAKREMEILKNAMHAVTFDVPMMSDGAVGKNWNELIPEQDYAF